MTVLPDGRFEARNVSVVDLARIAYGFEHVTPAHGLVTSSAGGWTSRDRFDVMASTGRQWAIPASGERIPAQLRPMLRSLLADRFALKARVENKRVSVFALRVVEKAKSPPNLRPSPADCLGPYTEPLPGALESTPRCSLEVTLDRIAVNAVTMADFARLLSEGGRIADRPVVDDTGLEGRYDIVIATGLPSDTAGTAGTLEHRRSALRYPIAVREAMKTQLGLELRSANWPMPTLIIEKAQRPLED